MYTVPGTCTVLYVVRSLQQNKWQSARKYWRWLACTVNNAVDARIVEAGASVSTGEYAVIKIHCKTARQGELSNRQKTTTLGRLTFNFATFVRIRSSGLKKIA